jgi:DNA-binding NarL/FixJ family response regulator
LQRYLRQYTDWQVVIETGDLAQIIDLIAQQQATSGLPDLLILGLPGVAATDTDSLALLRSLKQTFPYLRILLLAALEETLLQEAWWMGIEGCCWRSGGETELVEAIWQVAAGQTYWATGMKAAALGQSRVPGGAGEIRRRASNEPSWMQIDRALQAIERQLQSPKISALERLVLQGRRRELRASRWITRRLLPGVPAQPVLQPLAEPIAQIQANVSGGGIQLSNLFDRLAAKLRYPLDNRTKMPLEIDILRLDRKRELFYLVLRKFETSVDELRFSQVPADGLEPQRSTVLADLWQAVLTDFFGKYYRVMIGGEDIAVVGTLIQQQQRVEADILSRIPLVAELLGYLLFQQPLQVDNQQYPASSPVAMAQAEAILENLAIQIANAVIQPLLNQFADVEAIKQGFYDRQRLSTRDIERFRNDLSWRYRIDRYVSDPALIFASQYQLLILTEAGISCKEIYAPRRQELDALSGIPFAVTFLLEVRDAVAPRLRSATAFVGSGLVYVLTEVIGRGLGLVGRGILKGIGNALQERR